ncbi:MAG: glycosyltransferase family 2 protein [Thermodesulfobacteriota bacterium]
MASLPNDNDTPGNGTGPALSIVIPIYNEYQNIRVLHEDLSKVLAAMARDYEIIYVDDGSTDQSLAVLKEIAAADAAVTVIQLRRNFGQTAAISAGIDGAAGKVVVCMDADLQNDPADIPRLVAKLEEGYDLVSGWRQQRQDHWLWRKLTSAIANRLISLITRVKLHDYGCTLKAYRRDLLSHIRLYGQMHRFIPALAVLVGASLAEIPVNHRPRVHGKSNYGLGRTLAVILDLFTVKFLSNFSVHPLHLFGGSGLALIALSFVTGTIMVFRKLVYGLSIVQTPLLLLSALLFILGFHSILMGLTAEMVIRTYYESQNKPIYVIRQVFNSGKIRPESLEE